MMLKTHLMFAIFVSLVFFKYVNNQVVFIIMVIVATILPDLDSKNSTYGKNEIFAPIQSLTEHRGFIHSFTTAVILASLIAIWWPVASFGFFIGYCIHLITDSFTKEGIQPFWPFKWKTSGPLVTGGKIEELLFLALIFFNVFLFLVLFVWT